MIHFYLLIILSLTDEHYIHSTKEAIQKIDNFLIQY